MKCVIMVHVVIYNLVQISTHFGSNLEKVYPQTLPLNECPPGYDGKSCKQKCLPGFYGERCRSYCNCTIFQDCHNVLGCVCKEDYTGDNCHEECPEGYYGKSCIHQCLPGFYGEQCKSYCNCSIFQDCHNVLGCVCKIDYTGTNCDEVEEPPLITSQFEDTYYMTEDYDTTASFKCRSTGNPEPKFQWKKDNEELHDSLHIFSDQYTGELTITKPTKTDFGTYECTATNRHGLAVSAAFKIKRAFIGSFSNTALRHLPDIYEYTNVSVPCIGKPRCVPVNRCKVEWKLGEGTSNTITETKRIAIDKDGTLHFLYVELNDTSTTAKAYACGLYNDLTNAFYKGSSVVITVLKKNNTQLRIRPNLLFTHDVKGLLYGEAELQCVFSGYPLPEIQWYAPGYSDEAIYTNAKYEFTDHNVKRNLRIKNLTLKDEGNYTCLAFNIFGRSQAKVYLNVTSKPRFMESPRLESEVISNGQNAVFTCKMKSVRNESPPSAPVWRRNGIVLNPSKIGGNHAHKYQFSANRQILTIMNVKYPDDSSSISCETGNIIIDINGEDSYVRSYANAFLRVMACPSGSILTNGTSCEPCNENWYGNDCLHVCKCHGYQRCDNVIGCVHTTYSTSTQSTTPNTGVFEGKIFIPSLICACCVLLIIGLGLPVWKYRQTIKDVIKPEVHCINENKTVSQRHARVYWSERINDKIDETSIVENVDNKPIQMNRIGHANEVFRNIEDPDYHGNLDSTDMSSLSTNDVNLCYVHSYDQQLRVFNRGDKTCFDIGHERKHEYKHSQRSYKNMEDSSESKEQNDFNNENSSRQSIPLEENIIPTSHIYMEMQLSINKL